MALKTFNIDEQIYKEFSEYCKKNGISMSKQVENFFKEELMKIKLSIKMDARDIDMKEKKENLQKISQEEHPLSKYC
ncbi:MAG: hypothetical protein N3D20_01645 [Candidatus Pacearchaeota archaeon]|nr:hypothetical protein [Candidatus Pacearchaeota archaeon]